MPKGLCIFTPTVGFHYLVNSLMSNELGGVAESYAAVLAFITLDRSTEFGILHRGRALSEGVHRFIKGVIIHQHWLTR